MNSENKVFIFSQPNYYFFNRYLHKKYIKSIYIRKCDRLGTRIFSSGKAIPPNPLEIINNEKLIEMVLTKIGLWNICILNKNVF